MVPVTNWHVTLKFVGDVDATGAARLREALAREDLGHMFEARLGSLGAFPRAAQARVLWIGCSAGQEFCAELARRVERAAAWALGHRNADGVADVAGVVDSGDNSSNRGRPFSAHITLSRLRAPESVLGLLAAIPAMDEPLPVTEVILFRSLLGRGTPTYERLATYPLSRTPGR